MDGFTINLLTLNKIKFPFVIYFFHIFILLLIRLIKQRFCFLILSLSQLIFFLFEIQIQNKPDPYCDKFISLCYITAYGVKYTQLLLSLLIKHRQDFFWFFKHFLIFFFYPRTNLSYEWFFLLFQRNCVLLHKLINFHWKLFLLYIFSMIRQHNKILCV